MLYIMKIPLKIFGIKFIDIIINIVFFFVGLFAIGFAIGVGYALIVSFY